MQGRRTLDQAIKGTDFDQLDLMPADFTERLPHERVSVVAEAIPNRAVIEQMAQQRALVAEFAPRRLATAAYEALWARVRSCLTGTG